MSKTTELQIQKGRDLVKGLRKHLSTGVGGGITEEEINRMEKTLNELSKANDECDRLREELAPKVKHMNEVLVVAKASYTEYKKAIKGYYTQELWADYGVPDKR